MMITDQRLLTACRWGREKGVCDNGHSTGQGQPRKLRDNIAASILFLYDFLNIPGTSVGKHNKTEAHQERLKHGE